MKKLNICFDLDKLSALMTHFYHLTKIRIVIYDDRFHQILSVPSHDCAFCTALRQNAVLSERCTACDKNARVNCLESDGLYLYTCHAGLTEAISPIRINGIILGYIMLGQIIDKAEKKRKKEELLNYAQRYTGVDLNAAYDSLTTKSKEQMEAAVAIMEACACYVRSNRLVRINEDCLAVLISNYICSNPSEDLSVDALCKRFHVSRNKLYKISHDSYGTSIAAYVRKQRVNHAASLLRSGCTVADAAIRSGFGDYNYFSEIFKKETGILPGKYSRLNASEKQ